MLRKKVDGRTARRADTKSAILQAATKLFVRQGVSATSVDEIAEAAEVAKGSIYYNFESKNALVEALMHEYLELTRAALVAAADELRGVERQRAILSELLRVIGEHPDAARLMVNEIFRTDREWKATAQAWHDVTTGLLIEDLRQTHADENTCALIAATMVGGTLAAAMEWLVFRPELELAEVQAQVLASLGLT